MGHADLLDDRRLTLVGLLFEATSGVETALSRQLHRESGMAPQWFEVLLRLARSPDNRLRVSDLTCQMTLTISGVSRVIDRLEAEGLVRRETCPSDRRGTFAVLTTTGLERVRATIPGHLEQLERVLGALDEHDREQLEVLLRKLRDRVAPGATAGT